MDALTDPQGQALCRLARASIAHALGGPPVPPLTDEFAARRGACFVTLRWAAESPVAPTDEPTDEDDLPLQGCIGSLEPHRSLAADVAENAVAAALRDPRGRRLRLPDLDRLDVEVSVLGPLVPLTARSEAEAVAALRPHDDGVVLRGHGRRGTFLPQVWSTFTDPAEFLRELKRKAGLPAHGWDASYQLYRYSVQKWRQPAPGTG